MNISVIDVETTGLVADDGHTVVEVAAVTVSDVNGSWGVTDTLAHSFVNPHRPIPCEASAIHHIIDADVAGAPNLGEALDKVLFPLEAVDIMCAHNARFDRSFLPMLKDRRWIDSWRCSMHCWLDAPSFSNQALRYWLGIDLPGRGAHDAASDVLVTAHILCRLLAERSVEELLKLSTKAVVLKKVPFGKHAGALWSDVPGTYLDWASKQTFEDAPDVRFTVKHELARRATAARDGSDGARQ